MVPRVQARQLGGFLLRAAEAGRGSFLGSAEGERLAPSFGQAAPEMPQPDGDSAGFSLLAVSDSFASDATVKSSSLSISEVRLGLSEADLLLSRVPHRQKFG